ncbi:formate dehydrogenase subunit gamma [Desulforhopalus sp. IMCC35007]|uniref:formate dehydrogenase subunit gamma n=1 Tax=Desulforhopalus sp. IMCC35007 TaxID=2569543 RepID=UPI0010ADA65A|nr:formate dehydrogenase subunit gamma [Desulforhopalus sp. IMCC35007]TKB09428.1 formate dehydrogenase subunit gamma [Desulforhopalus sp. IMCC35007]
MKKIIFSIITPLILASAAYAADSQIWGEMILSNIKAYGEVSSFSLGPLFVLLQSAYFSKIFLVVVLAVPTVFLLHYLIIGPKVFSHDGDKIYVFSLFQRIIHLIAAVAFLILIPTGLMIIFGKYLGGGSLVLGARYLHGVATLMFIVSVIPMFLFWLIEMLPTLDDIKWVFILGGYLSKEIKEIPAGKFNAGQKMWFWVASLGGVVMIATGAAMYLQDFNYNIAASFGLSQIDFLRASALIHNVLAVLITAFFFTHAYMSLFAIKGAIHSIITGYKENDEVKYLHSSFYKKLKKQGQI